MRPSPAVWLVVTAGILLPARVVAAQSLGEVAHQEALRRQQIAEPGSVYDDSMLKPVGETPDAASDEAAAESTAAESPSQASPGTAESEDSPDSTAAAETKRSDDKRPEAYWRAQAASLSARIETLRHDQESLEHRLGTLRDLTEGRRESEAVAAFREMRQVESALTKVERDLAFLDQASKRLADDATRAGVPPDWIARPPAP